MSLEEFIKKSQNYALSITFVLIKYSITAYGSKMPFPNNKNLNIQPFNQAWCLVKFNYKIEELFLEKYLVKYLVVSGRNEINKMNKVLYYYNSLCFEILFKEF